MTDLPQLHSAAARSLSTWHDMVASGDLTDLRSIVHPDATFRSPVAFKPYKSADAVVLALSTVLTVFTDFAYHRQATTDDGLNVVLEFSARVGDKAVKGIDFVRFDEAGQIVDFEVMMRPLNGVQALAEEMGKRLGGIIPAYK
ncbi:MULTISPECIES: nuclear transport factor 2 family protein [unclassified Caulobacter]|uniref:nuclear transport factor 2 family protein n=1 Tax=unclassified Caulobacter TaxID=2648921 RepID=UPI000D3DC1AB|nr:MULTISPECIES: nuclear transport factor 2 family protein [unclassified Caulobacter]PTS88423.1 polyketide cyclase [Caulobacter sp. HMWF009]PTT07359.1 polyketide cyclase [Caulobacter sp. HMWF025]